MLNSIKLYLNEYLTHQLYEQLKDLNSEFNHYQCFRLRLMVSDIIQHGLNCDSRQSILAFRSCLLMIIQGITDAEILETVHIVLELIPSYEFEEPKYEIVNSSHIQALNPLQKELENIFGVNIRSYMQQTEHRQKALLHTLRHQSKQASCVCPISWDDIFENGKLNQDVVAIFEEEPCILSENSSHFENSNMNKTLSAITIVDASEDLTPNSIYSVNETDFPFITIFIDGVMNSSFDMMHSCYDFFRKTFSNETLSTTISPTISRCISNLTSDSLSDENDSTKQINYLERTHSLLEFNQVTNDHINTNSLNESYTMPPLHLNTNSDISLKSFKNDQNELNRSKLWTMTTDSFLKFNYYHEEVSHDDSIIKPTNIFSEIQRKKKQSTKLIIRCHLYKGNYLKEWLDMGKWINPSTRYPILTTDWCRITQAE